MFTYLQIAGPVANLTANTAGSGTGRIQVVSLPGGINCSSAVPANDPVGCTEAYNSGITISVAAIPDQGSEFTGWSGDLTGVVSPSPLTMDANKAITGTFDLLPAITVTSPNGGESLRRGTTVPITWTYVSDPGAFVAIQLLQGTKVIKNITRRVGVAIGSGGTGSFNWRIPRFFRRLGSNFKVKITSTTVPIATDTSDNDFSFVP
jgi:hypothetical protein